MSKAFKVIGAILAAVGGVAYAVFQAVQSDEADNDSKYKVIFNGEEDDEEFDSYDEAEERALYMCSCAREGAELLHLSNPGDHGIDDYSDDYEIIEK